MKISIVRQSYLLFISVLSIFLITGCDGGGTTGHWDGPSDIIAPAVTFTVAANSATLVPVGNKVTATFTEEMAPATINRTTFTLRKGGGGTIIGGDVTYAGVTAVFTPENALTPDVLYIAMITTGAKDLAGNALASNYVWSFTTTPVPDTTPPTVTLTAPVNNATGIAFNTEVAATFSELMDPATISTATFTLQESGPPLGTVLTGTVTYAGLTATFKPASNLAASTKYTATVTTGAEDLAGNALASNYVWVFTTGAAPDTTRPTVTLTVPAEGATGVAKNTTVAATFSESMKSTTITTLTFTLQQDATMIGGTVVSSGANATFTPDANLVGDTTYIARITTGAQDLAGNALIQDYVWSFTTSPAPDTTRPTVTLTVPADTAIGVATNTTVAATFSEPMASLTITNQTFTLLEDGGTDVEVGTVDYLDKIAVFTPDFVLKPNTKYIATISSTVTDQALIGNELAGNQPPPLPDASDYVWSFTTGAALDTTTPTVTITNPDDSETDVPINKTINATFSEAMKPATMTTANFLVEETLSGDPVEGTVSYDIENNIATFSPLTDLMFETQYTATVSDQAQDLAGNPLVVPAEITDPTPNPWTFTTVAAAVPPVDLAINLRGIASFGIASRAGLTSTGVTVVNGDVALYPLAGCTDSTGNAGASQDCLVKTYSSPTGMTVNGSIYYAGDPFDNGGTANSVTNDLNIAWNEGKNKVDTMAGVLTGQLGGKTLTPGVYNEANLNLMANSVATFDALNDANAIFIIKVGVDFVDSGTLLLPTEIALVNGAQTRNIWFVVGRDITIGSGSTFNGNILAGRDVTVNDGSTVMGRVLGGASGAGAVVLTGAASPSVTTITVPQ